MYGACTERCDAPCMRLIQALTATAVIAAVAGLPAGARAEPGRSASADLTTADLETLAAERQLPLLAMADDVDTVTVTDPRFSATAIDIETNSVVVYRVGGAPIGTTAAAYAAVPARNGARISYKPALLTDKQTRDAVESVTRARGELAATGIEVTAVTPEIGGPVTIGVADLTVATLSLATRFAAFGPGTVRVERKERGQAPSRQDDGPVLYAGGSRIKPAGGGGCSSGFSARHSTGRRYIITAFHCVNESDRRFWDGGDDYMGSADQTTPARDMALIGVNSDNYLYVGGYDSNAKKEVTQASAPRTGMVVCTSGSYSGAVCGGRVVGWTTVWTFHDDGRPYEKQVWLAEQVDHLGIVGHGDSGGPVVISNADQTTVVAVGVISHMEATNNPAACRGLPTTATRKCSYIVGFGDVATQAAAWGLSLTN